MRPATIAKNYAEALFAAGEQSGDTARFASLIEAVAGAIEADDRIRLVLESPRVPKATKSGLLRRALEGKAPVVFVRFLDAVVRRGRQGLIPDISRQYLALLDVKLNRLHAGVVAARMPDAALQGEIAERLSAVFGKEVIPHFREDPALIGGLVVRVGDRVLDGSVRRKLLRLRTQMLGG
ncbi:MAG TPA: ATP synthase F1 subunit delta [Gemmatimonadales bacterium]|nr:ATP synthase F1 subunit delta [Gemmatimonadales bacterium]